MTPARHSAAGDGSLTASVARNLVVAVAFVLASALAFWAAGQFGAGADDIEVVGAPDGQGTGADDPTGEDTPAASPAEGETTADEAASPVTDAPTSEEPTDEATPTETEEPAEEEPADSGARIPPGEISIQVLDAVLDDGDAAAERTAEELRGDGYRVVVVNDSYRVYDTTTVFYTAGNEAAARQLASEYGFARVEPKPDNLSDSVDIHLVVGRDRA